MVLGQLARLLYTVGNIGITSCRLQKSTFKDKRKTTSSIITLVLVAVAAVTFTNAYEVSQRDYVRKVESMRSGVEEATKNLLGPMSGIERQSATIAQGKTFSIFPCVDVSCPIVETHWYLLADKNADASLEKDIKAAVLEKSGSSKWAVNVIVGVLGKSEQPYAPPDGKEWFNITVTTTNAPN